MVNSGYSPRHSARTVAIPVPAARRGGRRLQFGIVAVAGIALLAIVIGLAVASGPGGQVRVQTSQTAKPAAGAAPAAYATGPVSVRRLASRRYHFGGPTAAAAARPR